MTRHTPRRDRARSGNIRGPPQRRSRHSSAPTVPICAATGGGIGRLAGPRARIRASAVATAAPASAPPTLAGHAQIHGAAHVHQRRRNTQRNNNSFHRTSPCPPQRNNRRDGTDEGKSGCPGVILLRLPQSPLFPSHGVARPPLTLRQVHYGFGQCLPYAVQAEKFRLFAHGVSLRADPRHRDIENECQLLYRHSEHFPQKKFSTPAPRFCIA